MYKIYNIISNILTSVHHINKLRVSRLLVLVGCCIYNTVLGQVPATAVGKTEGNFSVDLMGRANYSMPLFVVPGTAGIQPQLSINYTSGGVNGLLGSSFTLGGLSAITRGGTNTVNSDAIRPVTYTTTDNFYLDGQLLVLASGTAGVSGAEYRTENETFSKIVYYATSAPVGFVGPWLPATYFQVWTKNGQILEYGNTFNARIEASGSSSVKTWAINKVTDRQGNYMTYDYFEDNAAGLFYPLQINYTGNAAAGLAPYASVRFTYDLREDNFSYWYVGSQSFINKRLLNIKTYYGANVVRTYNLSYQNAGLVRTSKLIALQECGSDGTCVEATRFNWSINVQPQFGAAVNTYDYSANSTNNYNEWNNTAGTAPTKMADVNGDGRDDMVAFGSAGTYVSLSRGDGSFDQPALKLSHYGINQGWSTTPRFLGDVNGDGMADIVGMRFWLLNVYVTTINMSAISVAFASGGGNFTTPVDFNGTSNSRYTDFMSDVNADGRQDMVSIRYDGVYVSLSTGNGFAAWIKASDEFRSTDGWGSSTKPVLLSDANGDGLPDINGFDASTDRVTIGLGQSSGLFKPAIIGSSNFNGHRSGYTAANPCQLGDVNGDGLADIVSFTPSGVCVASAKGNGYFEDGRLVKPMQFTASDYWDHNKNPCYVADVTGDGMADLVGFGNSYMAVLPATGSGNFSNPYTEFYQYTGSAGWNGPQKPTLMADVDGNGTKDVVGFDRNTLKVSLAAQQKETVYQVLDGFGNSTLIGYRPLTDPTVYSKSSGSVYPIGDVTGPLQVVSTVSVSNGVGSSNTVTRTYGGYKVNFLRGSGGFTSISTIDNAQGIQKTVTYNPGDYHYPSMPTAEYTFTTSGRYLSIVYYTPTLVSFGPAPKERWFPYYSGSTEYKYELNGSYIKSISNSFLVDSYGNVLKKTLTHSDGHQNITTCTYNNDATNWLLGLVLTRETQQLATGQPTITKTKYFEYYTESNKNNLVKRETINKYLPQQLDKDYYYDLFGNITSANTIGSNGWLGTETRNQTSTYDATGRYMNSNQNALSHREYKTYDNYFLELSQYTDRNNLTTNYTYDGYGRVKTTTGPDLNVSTQTIAWCYGGNAPTYAKYSVTTTPASGLPPTIEYFDILGRKIRVEKTGFDGRKIFNDVVYNAKGQVEKSAFNYYAGTTPTWVTMQYDAFGRLSSTYTPYKGTASVTYTGLSTMFYNELGQLTTKYVDCVDQLVKTIDNIGNAINYEYTADGMLKKTTDVNGVTTSMQYDINGNRTYMYDPSSKATYTYYNAFGELYQTQNNAGQVTSHQLDKLGRITYTSEPNSLYPTLNYTYTYDQGVKAIGKPSRIVSSDGYTETYVYDNLGRLSSTDYWGFTFTRTYDQYNREVQLTYPSGFSVQNEYNAYNYLAKVKDPYSAYAYYTATGVNALGQVTTSLLGNGLQNENIYNEIGQLKYTKTGMGIYATVQHLEFWYNAVGNVTGRRDYRRNLQEVLSFDALNRLQNVTLQYAFGNPASSTNLQMVYSPNGNISYKSDVGSYMYEQVRNAGPYAVTSTPLGSYGYDAIGNMTSGPGFTATYTQFNLPLTYDKGNGQRYVYWYNPSHTKNYEQYIVNNVVARQTYYRGGIYEQEITNGTDYRYKHYIMADGKVVAIYNRTWTAATGYVHETVYLHRDHLGSVTEITDQAGVIKESLSYDVWGKRRNSSTWTNAAPFNLMPYYDLGFTGHESMDDLGFIDMKGRIYSPTLGRFLSADAYIQAPDNMQNFNRYSYCVNNPLSYTDPTGQFFIIDDIIVAAVIGAFINVAVQAYAGNINSFGDFFKAAGVGALAGAGGAFAGQFVASGLTVGGFAGGAIVGAAGGAVGGFIGGAGNAWAQGANFSDGLKAGFKGGVGGAITGGIIGGVAGGIDAYQNDANFWNGEVGEVGGSCGKTADFLDDESLPMGKSPTQSGEVAKTATNEKYGKYGMTRNGGMKAHCGIDYVGEVGDPVFAQYDGVVERVGLGKDYGPQAVRTSMEYNNASYPYKVDYGHLSESLVSVGDRVVAGQQIGYMGRLGNLQGTPYPTHVHVGIWRPTPTLTQGFVMPYTNKWYKQ